MFAARFAAVGLALLVLVASAQAQPARVTVPNGLHGFLLRADEPQTASFPRTPSFAWNPVSGARSYQFQLSLSSSFRESGIIFEQGGLTTPVAAPTITLPWITGDPHSLYARVRAIRSGGTTPWSKPFGFDIIPPAAPRPLPSYDGLLRWSLVEGADAYQVWLVDVPKIETVVTNVLDEREFYTFHRTTAWTSQVRWRVRALRMNNSDISGGQLRHPNALPVVTYGPWSATYASQNAPYSGGQIKLVGTVSDVIAAGASPTHRYMPAFVFSGDQSLAGVSAELFRVYVFTDRQCLNRVFTSAVIGGPAYAPRPLGPLPLPTTLAGLAGARSTYFTSDGAEPNGFTADGEPVQANESLPAATPTTAVPSDTDTNPNGSGSNPPSAPNQITFKGTPGAPIDLWDTDPANGGGYYWTVVPVVAFSPGFLQTNINGAGALAGSSTVPVVSANGFSPGDTVLVGNVGNQEGVTVTAATGGALTISAPLKFSHGGGEPVVRTGGNLRYEDLDLPQDTCAAGHVMRFSKASEPSLVSAGELFATGLSSSGHLASGTRAKAFYGSPLVAWTPALGADAYEVQWSKTRNPFNPLPDPGNQGALGRLTLGTSAVLPLKPGVWYYRVRGFDYSLATGTQQMSWSDPTRIVVAKPKFRVVGH